NLDAGRVGLDAAQQIEYWIGVLDRCATGDEKKRSGWAFLAGSHVRSRLDSLGEASIPARLQFVLRWADKPEFKGDGLDGVESEPMSSVVVGVLLSVYESSVFNPEVESLLQEIIRVSVRTNSERTLWGIIPVWSARCLNRLADYPEPQQDDSTNRLINDADFLPDRE
ncbi:MAG: hypothetical protein AAFX50_24840, partial [Acidobacteriota bacterium]